MIRDRLHIPEAEGLPEGFMQALNRWRVEVDSILHSGRIGWYAKLVSTTFEYDGIKYIVTPRDVYDPEVYRTYDEQYCLNVLEAGFEILQGTITRDLKELGATDIQNWGFLD